MSANRLAQCFFLRKPKDLCTKFEVTYGLDIIEIDFYTWLRNFLDRFEISQLDAMHLPNIHQMPLGNELYSRTSKYSITIIN